MSTAFQNFLTKWWVTQRLPSVAYPQSNSRAELGVKTAKRIINDNTSHQGGIILCDHIPRNEKRYHLHQEWLLLTATKYEKALPEKHKDVLNQYNQSSKELSEIPVGFSVLIHEPKNKGIHQWIKSGIVLNVLPNWQYRIKCNHSGKITLKKRWFTKPIEQQTPLPTISPGNNNVKQSTEHSSPTRNQPTK